MEARPVRTGEGGESGAVEVIEAGGEGAAGLTTVKSKATLEVEEAGPGKAAAEGPVGRPKKANPFEDRARQGQGRRARKACRRACLRSRTRRQ